MRRFVAIVWVGAAACAEPPRAAEGPGEARSGALHGGAWQAPVVVSPGGFDAGVRFNFGKSIAVDGAGVLHVAWVDIHHVWSEAEVQGQVFHQRSGDGQLWSTPQPLTPVLERVGYPKVAAFGSYVYVAWHDTRLGGPHAYLRRSPNHGVGFEAETLVTPDFAGLPAIAAWGPVVYAVWAAGTPSEVYQSASTDNGLRWSPPSMVSADPLTGGSDGKSSWTPVVEGRGAQVYVAWTDDRNNARPDGGPYDCGLEGTSADGGDLCREDVYFRRSVNLGQTWEEPIRVSWKAPAVGHNAASLALDDANRVHLVYFGKPSPHEQLFYARSTTDGLSFEPERALTGDPTVRFGRPSVAAWNDHVEIVAHAFVPGQGAILVHASSTNGGDAVTSSTPVIAGNRAAMQPSVVIDPAGKTHLVYVDRSADGRTQVFYSAR